MTPCRNVLLLASVSLLPLLPLVGCGFGSPTTAPSPAGRLRGNVHGAQQPVSGATISLFAAGTSGYGSGAVSLLTTPVTTDASGNFSISGDYACPSSTSQVYLVATGGNPGLAPGTANPTLALTAALGPCTLRGTQYTLDPSSFITVNEVTTIASAYALKGFIDPAATQVGTSSTNTIGLANAFQTVRNLVDLTTGQALSITPAGNGTSPQAALNTLANILAPCVNSDGTGAPCSSLFAAATPAGGAAPTNTIQAAVNIASQPVAQVAALYALSTATAPFQPSLSTAPNDWSLSIYYIIPSVYPLSSLAIDGFGNVWTTSHNSVIKLNNAGASLSGASGFPDGGAELLGDLSIDPANNVWMLTQAPGAVVKLGNDGTLLSPVGGYTIPAMTSPHNIALDGLGNAWVLASCCGSIPAVFKLSNAGVNLSGPSGFAVPAGTTLSNIAIDSAEAAWISGTPSIGSDFLLKYATDGTLLSPAAGFPVNGVSPEFPPVIAIDSANNAWTNEIFLSASTHAFLNEYSPTGSLLSPVTGYLYADVATIAPYVYVGQTSVSIDGADNLWLGVNYYLLVRGQPTNGRDGIVKVSPSGSILSGAFGYTTGYANAPTPDSSGNIWVLGSQALVEVIGLATPTETPLSAAVRDNKLGQRP